MVSPSRVSARLRTTVLASTLLLVAVAAIGPDRLSVAYAYAENRVEGDYTVEQRLAQFGGAARARLAPHFAAAGVIYPPEQVALVAFKDSRQLLLFARNRGADWRQVTVYPITAASGSAGPKLREGDRQVPEGAYRVVFLNPNSLYHVSMRLDYPNAFDRAMATADGRSDLGGDIMIHGKAVSIGCLAVGDPAAEDLFTLAADIGQGNIEVLLAPTDLRVAEAPRPTQAPTWAGVLYAELRRRLGAFPLQPAG